MQFFSRVSGTPVYVARLASASAGVIAEVETYSVTKRGDHLRLYRVTTDSHEPEYPAGLLALRVTRLARGGDPPSFTGAKYKPQKRGVRGTRGPSCYCGCSLFNVPPCIVPCNGLGTLSEVVELLEHAAGHVYEATLIDREDRKIEHLVGLNSSEVYTLAAAAALIDRVRAAYTLNAKDAHKLDELERRGIYVDELVGIASSLSSPSASTAHCRLTQLQGALLGVCMT